MPATDNETERAKEDLLFAGQVKSFGAQKHKVGCCYCSRKYLFILLIVILVVIALGLIALAIYLKEACDSEAIHGNATSSQSNVRKVKSGAVVSDHEACSQVGRDILAKYGTAVDAAIATLLCNGVRTPHSMGIGGGCFMVIYDKSSQTTHTINGRETVPAAMTNDDYLNMTEYKGCFMVVHTSSKNETVVINGREIAPSRMTTEQYVRMAKGCYMVVYDRDTRTSTMFDGMSIVPHTLTTPRYNSMRGINARRIGVPGELKAYREAHYRYGRLPWKELFEPSIKMMRDGFPLSSASSKALQYLTENPRMPYNLTNFPAFCEIFCADKKTGIPKAAGDMVYMPKLAQTYEGIANEGPEYLYATPVTRTIVKEIKEQGGVLDEEDFTILYKALVGKAMSIGIGNYTLHSMGDATGGPIVGLVANILQGFNLTSEDMATPAKRADTYHKIIEAFKLTYTEVVGLGDPNFEEGAKAILKRMKSDSYADYLRSKITDRSHDMSYYTQVQSDFPDTQGTSHVSVLSPYGDAVSVTSTINWYFGSLIVSNSTGIIWNNEMDDFNASGVVNFVEPGKRPRSSMAPVIVTDKGGHVRLVTGAAGGSRIANAVAQIVAKLIFMDQPLETTIEERRFHHTLFPKNKLQLEKGFPEDIHEMLKLKGHMTETYKGSYMAVAESILVDADGKISAHADSRKPPGSASYVYKNVNV